MRALLRRLFAGLFIATLAASPVYAASSLSLLTGPQPAADLTTIINDLIVDINASGPFTGTVSGPETVSYTSDSATPGTVRAITGSVTVGADLSMTSGNLVGARGDLTVGSGETAGGTAYLYALQGKLIGGGTFASGLNAAAAVAQWDFSTGTYTSGIVSGLWIDAGASASASAQSTSFGGASQLLRMTNTTNAGAAKTTQLIDIYANSDTFMALGAPADTIAYIAAAGTGSGSCAETGGMVATKVIHITVSGVDYWIPLCDSNS